MSGYAALMGDLESARARLERLESLDVNESAGGLVKSQAGVLAGDLVSGATTDSFATTYAMPAGTLNTVGKVMRVTARGQFWSNSGSIVPAISFQLKFGSTEVASAGTFGGTLTTTKLGWKLEVDVICVTVATANNGAVEAQGMAIFDMTGQDAWVSSVQNDAAVGSVALEDALTVSIQVTQTNAQTRTRMRTLTIEVLG